MSAKIARVVEIALGAGIAFHRVFSALMVIPYKLLYITYYREKENSNRI